ncbi:hypothetical protein TRFO_07915 [Tritrichomonas foetus]|uniref:Uncharacterized protein n=1 Tax=Tritrichomonas foetus TaxID=1144522 RepID=A0A1J4JQ86_9EUKA|nr:hypothetical protein TRFO_07915 [Tritrichomonas foetus]|eukprot:OHT00576.1 hypothetical protein TRFO_07915 [Tritrichomonas foetus]
MQIQLFSQISINITLLFSMMNRQDITDKAPTEEMKECLNKSIDDLVHDKEQEIHDLEDSRSSNSALDEKKENEKSDDESSPDKITNNDENFRLGGRSPVSTILPFHNWTTFITIMSIILWFNGFFLGFKINWTERNDSYEYYYCCRFYQYCICPIFQCFNECQNILFIWKKSKERMWTSCC